MEQMLICRTCLKTKSAKSNFVNIFNKTEFKQMAVKDILEIFMPEMDLDISDGETVICFQCYELLEKAYSFKKICLKTEEKIYDYLHQYNIKLGDKISLNNIIDQKVVETIANSNSVLKLSILSQVDETVTSLEQNNTDSNHSSLLFNSGFDGCHSANEETQETATLPKTQKRKRMELSKKFKKSHDYISLKRSYTCDQCEYKAYRMDLLETHKQKHNQNMLSVKEYKCDFCLYSTTRKRALDRHLFIHKGHSQHLCDICKKPFAEKYQLKLHSITHTGQELPHKCGECGKGYLTKSYLKQHMETKHLAKYKQDCHECIEDSCGHSFSRYYTCNICESSFSDKRGLDAHTFTHTGGELPYKCLHCNFTTAWKGNLKKHMQNKH